MTLAEFLAARLREDEERAGDAHLYDCDSVAPPPGPFPCDCWVPARELRQVTAMRAILAEHEDTRDGHIYDHPDGLMCVRCADADRDGEPYAERPYPCQTLRALAAVYSDHPDYDEKSWKPWKGAWPGD